MGVCQKERLVIVGEGSWALVEERAGHMGGEGSAGVIGEGCRVW